MGLEYLGIKDRKKVIYFYIECFLGYYRFGVLTLRKVVLYFFVGGKVVHYYKLDCIFVPLIKTFQLEEPLWHLVRDILLKVETFVLVTVQILTYLCDLTCALST